jgi:serine/threonine protein kinase
MSCIAGRSRATIGRCSRAQLWPEARLPLWQFLPCDTAIHRIIPATSDMSLAPGVRLGAYEIVAMFGAGGMVEVYRARVTRLGRDVAIEVIPDAAPPSITVVMNWASGATE